MGGVLSGIKVAAFAHYAAGPLTAQFLGALGADVIKIEAPSSDLNRYAVRDPDGKFGGISPYFITLNRNQRGLGLNLKTKGGQDVAHRLVRWADVLVENYKPGAMEKLRLGYEDVRELNKQIIYCSISAYDLLGPSRDVPGQDLLIQAMSGLASLTGREGGPPVPIGTYAIDSYTSLLCVIGILAALRHRDKTGKGQWVRADMMTSALHMMAQEASYTMNLDPGQKRSRAGIAHVDQAAPYAIYETMDGAFAMSLAPSDLVGKLSEKLGVLEEIRPYISDRGMKYHRDEITEVIAKGLRKMKNEEAMKLVSSVGILVAPVRNLAETLKDPAIVASNVIRKVTASYGGEYRIVMEPLKMSESPVEFVRPSPAHGEHTFEILKELEYSAEAIDRLVTEKAIFGPPVS